MIHVEVNSISSWSLELIQLSVRWIVVGPPLSSSCSVGIVERNETYLEVAYFASTHFIVSVITEDLFVFMIIKQYFTVSSPRMMKITCYYFTYNTQIYFFSLNCKGILGPFDISMDAMESIIYINLT